MFSRTAVPSSSAAAASLGLLLLPALIAFAFPACSSFFLAVSTLWSTLSYLSSPTVKWSRARSKGWSLDAVGNPLTYFPRGTASSLVSASSFMAHEEICLLCLDLTVFGEFTRWILRNAEDRGSSCGAT